jgi:hypothetical protein
LERPVEVVRAAAIPLVAALGRRQAYAVLSGVFADENDPL